MSSVSVDYGPLKQLEKQLKAAHNKQLKAGWFESAKYDDGTPVAGIAAQNEFGNPKISIPARPFLRPTVESEKTNWAKKADALLGRVVEGKTSMADALGVLGVVVTADIKTGIAAGNHAPLSPITIALRRLRNDGVPIGGKLVGAVAGAIAEGKTGSGQLGDQTFGNTDPLRETGYMIATLSSEVI